MRRRLVFALLTAFALGACKEDGHGTGGNGVAKARLLPVFGRVPAQPPGDLGKLTIGMSVEEARAVARVLVPRTRAHRQTTASDVPGMDFVVGLDDAEKAIDFLGIELAEDPKASLTAAWGPGEDAACFAHTCTFWFEPGTRMAAKLDGRAVEFWTYAPVDQLLGKVGMLAIETTPILGATVEQMTAAYGDAYIDEKPAPGGGEPNDWLVLQPDRHDSDRKRAAIDLERGVVIRARVSFRYESPAEKAALVAAMTTAWGKPTETKDLSRRTVVQWVDAATGRRATLDGETHSDYLEVELEPYLGLAPLLGRDPRTLGFETTPILGMTWEDVVKTYSLYLGGDPAGTHAFDSRYTTLFLPSTGPVAGRTQVRLDYGADGRVASYTLGLEYGDDPSTEAAIAAAFARKWGTPTITEFGGAEWLLLREGSPRITAESSNGAWNLTVRDK